MQYGYEIKWSMPGKTSAMNKDEPPTIGVSRIASKNAALGNSAPLDARNGFCRMELDSRGRSSASTIQPFLDFLLVVQEVDGL